MWRKERDTKTYEILRALIEDGYRRGMTHRVDGYSCHWRYKPLPDLARKSCHVPVYLGALDLPFDHTHHGAGLVEVLDHERPFPSSRPSWELAGVDIELEAVSGKWRGREDPRPNSLYLSSEFGFGGTQARP